MQGPNGFKVNCQSKMPHVSPGQVQLSSNFGLETKAVNCKFLLAQAKRPDYLVGTDDRWLLVDVVVPGRTVAASAVVR